MEPLPFEPLVAAMTNRCHTTPRHQPLGCFVVVMVAVLGGAGCGSDYLDTSINIEVQMQGAFEVPVGAEGSHDPDYQIYLLESVTAVNDETQETIIFYSGARGLRVVNRPQLIIKRNIDDFVGVTMTDFTVTFNPRMFVGTRFGEYAVDLDNPSLTLTDPVTISRGIGAIIRVDVKWRNTVARDEATDPPTETVFVPGFEITAQQTGALEVNQ